MDILSKLPFLNDSADGDVVADGAEEKAARIQFHRESVRNGPVKFKNVTSGQVRRLRQRELNRKTKKARRAQIRDHLSVQRKAGVVRAHLQFAGVLPFYGTTEIDRQKQVTSTVWIVQRFGSGERLDLSYDGVVRALQGALDYYTQAFGHPAVKVPTDYIVPVYEEGTEPQA